MKPKSGSEKALEYIESHSIETSHKLTGPCITVSRQSGAGSSLVDEKLKVILESHQKPEYGEWAIFDRNLMEKIMDDHNIPDRLQKLFTLEKQSAITNMVTELLGLQPSIRTILHKTAQTILQLAQTGNCIIVGRASNVVTEKLKNTFHVRLVAPLEDRINRIQSYYSFNRKDALEWIKKEDQTRKEYYLKNYHKDIDDTLLYHMVINTNLIAIGYVIKECAAEDIIECIETVITGKHYISPVISEYLLARSRKAEDTGSIIRRLTPSERTILKFIADKKTSQEIADSLFISKRTVENHRLNICNKLELHGVNALLKFAIENKFLL